MTTGLLVFYATALLVVAGIFLAGYMVGRYFFAQHLREAATRMEAALERMETTRAGVEQVGLAASEHLRLLDLKAEEYRRDVVKWHGLFDDLRKVAIEWGEKQDDPAFSRFIKGLPWGGMSTYMLPHTTTTTMHR